MPVRLDTVEFLLSETDPLRLGPCEAEVAFAGRSNAGKSSLINALCRKSVARVAKAPGRTRAITVFRTRDGLWLVDLPGYGFARGPAEEQIGWGPMIEGYLATRPCLRMVFALFDAGLGPGPSDLQLIEFLDSRGLPWRAVAAKADQVRPSAAGAKRRDAARVLGLEPQDLHWVSARDKTGLRELYGEVAGLLSRR
jgi:GTP-binding protein